MDALKPNTLEVLERLQPGSLLRIWFLSFAPSQWIEARVVENHLSSSSAVDIQKQLQEIGLKTSLQAGIPSFILVYSGLLLEFQESKKLDSIDWPRQLQLDINLMWVPAEEKFVPQLRIPFKNVAAFPVKKVDVLR